MTAGSGVRRGVAKMILWLLVSLPAACASEESQRAGDPQTDDVPQVFVQVLERIEATDVSSFVSGLPASAERPMDDDASSRWIGPEPIEAAESVGADTPRYFLWYSPNERRFWIMVGGGFMGDVEWRGPFMSADVAGADVGRDESRR